MKLDWCPGIHSETGEIYVDFFKLVVQNKLARHVIASAAKLSTEIYHAVVTIAFLNGVLPEVCVDTS